jgi:cation transport regulator ChaC
MQNGGGQDRIDARPGPSGIPPTKAPADAMPILVGECTKGLRSSEPGERDNARAMLVQLAVRKGHDKPEIANAVDTSLEHNMERLENERHLNTLTYIAGKSSCSIAARRHAAVILANQERRTENLVYVERHTQDLEIKVMMKAALEDRGHSQ